MIKRSVPLLLLLVLFAIAASRRGAAYDFHGWREDGTSRFGSSIGQQSTHQAFNLYEDFIDPAFGSFALYWKGELQASGGTTTAPDGTVYGNVPPTADILDTREQDLDIPWDQWGPVFNKTLMPKPSVPKLTPNLPQAWGPIEMDLDANNESADHLVLAVNFEPPRVGASQYDREQVLNAYYPQITPLGINPPLPSNAPTPTGDAGRLRPLWRKDPADAQHPGLRIRDLEPLDGTDSNSAAGVGVVTQAPILARVPSVYKIGTKTVAETVPVVYLVVGTGEENDYARVICINLKGHDTDTANPDDNIAVPDRYNSLFTTTIAPPNDRYFDPNNAAGDATDGDVMWSYRVEGRGGGNPAVPVAGISFANIGDTNNSRPLLFVTTTDGQLICLNAKAADIQPVSGDGDPAITPSAPTPRWTWKSRDAKSGALAQFNPGFHYGMSPAVARVPLAQAFPNGTNSRLTVTNAINKHGVTEWMVFAADTYGRFWAWDAEGTAQFTGMMNPVLTGWDPGPSESDDEALVRWVDLPGTNGNDFRRDPMGNPERFIVPPVVYQGNSPLKNSAGAIVNGSTDRGYDDEVIFASERGNIYALDCIGELEVDNGGADDGKPTGDTFYRWKFPTDDTPFAPAAGTEPRAWPRNVDGGSIAQDANLFIRSPLGVALGGGTNPDGFNPNLDIGDDVVYVPYLHEQQPVAGVIALPHYTAGVNTPRNSTVPAGYRAFYEYVGSLKPYGFVQTTRPILDLVKVEWDDAGNWREIPLNKFQLGSVKSDAVGSNEVQTILAPGDNAGNPNPNYLPGTPVAPDTIYLIDNSYYDETDDQYYTVPMGVEFRIEYTPPTSATDNTPGANVQEDLDYPSAHRRALTTPNDPDPNNRGDFQDFRERASLTVHNVRLEQRLVTTRQVMAGDPITVDTLWEEGPALVKSSFFTVDPYTTVAATGEMTGEGGRGGGMIGSGSASRLGTLFVPSWFRGRVNAYTHRLDYIRPLYGAAHPRLETSPGTIPTSDPTPTEHYGPPLSVMTPPPAEERNTYDPGLFNIRTSTNTDEPSFLDDFPVPTDVGSGSMAVTDGWLYITFRNGHVRGWSNVGGGTGTFGPYGPIYIPPLPGTNGTLVEAPGGGSSRGIFMLQNTVTNSTNIQIQDVYAPDPAITMGNRPRMIMNGNYNRIYPTAGSPNLEPALLFEYGQSIVMAVDYGPVSQLRPAQSVDPDDGTLEIDEQILDQDLPVQGQIRSSNGAVQQIGTPPRGTRPQITDVTWDTEDHVVAFVPIFCGIPSPSNALTPGTPMLWERDPASANWNFTGELTYDIQVTQPGIQWRWPDDMTTGASSGNPDTNKQHYWEVERNNGNVRFPTTGGTTAGAPRWSWTGAPSEWAPLVSYNNPLLMYYDPDGGTNSAVSGIVGPGGTPTNTVGAVNSYTAHTQMGRKNGDAYDMPAYPAGSRSGGGRPIVPVVGAGVTSRGTRQLLFADHGKASPVQKAGFPDLARVRVADRSLMGLIGRQLSIRVQPAALTKMGRGAAFGIGSDASLRNLDTSGPAGSFEQNRTGYDDAPNGLYSSIPDQRLLVSKASTGLNVATNAVPIGGRNPANPTALPGFAQAEVLAVQVDVPRYAADDIYSTRYRGSTPAGSTPASAFNPLYPSTVINGASGASENGRPMFDRAEVYSRAPAPPPLSPQATELVTRGEDPGTPVAPLDPNTNDRTRRVAVYIDANGNGQLDLLPTYREAYRTFAVQVMVKPEMKLEGQSQLLDLGSIPHGKRQPGLDANPGTLSENTIREYQRMMAMAGGTAAQQNVSNYWQQFWRPFTISNTGNVNLAYIKPEVAFTLPGPITQLVGIPSEGNDPWRVLPFINASTATALQDPLQIFLRTSFDDQLLPTTSSAYGNGRRGIWLQKAALGAGAPGSVLYAAGNGMGAVNDPAASASAVHDRDPSVSGTARSGYVSLNIPTGSPLGQYSGSLRFFNDRAVSFVEDFTVAAGYRYVNTLGAGANPDGTLARANDGTPIEPVTDPPFKIKARVTEALVFGRGTYDDNFNAAPEAQPNERRMMPAAIPDASSITLQGQAQKLLLAYSSNQRGLSLGSPNTFDLFGSQMMMDTTRLLFPFDELQHLRPGQSFFREPWSDPSAPANSGFSRITTAPGLTQITKPAVAQTANGSLGFLMWVARQTLSQGNDQYRLQYQSIAGGAIKDVNPGGVVNTQLARSGVRLLPVNGGNWLTFSAIGNAVRRGIAYTNSANPDAANAIWTPEHEIATSKSLTTVNNPHVITTDTIGGAANQTAWVSYDGLNQRLGRTDLYMTRYLTSALTTAGQRGVNDPLNPSLDYGQVGFPRVETLLGPSGSQVAIGGEVLQANPTRTSYTASGIDWLIRDPMQDPNGNFRVQVYLSRPEIAAGADGSFTRPKKLIANLAVARLAQTGELIYDIDPALFAGLPAASVQTLQQTQILVDAAAGSVRFTTDARTLARLLMPAPAMGPASPDPIVAADYTPATMRLNRGDVSGTNPILVPTISSSARTIYDASWYLQQRDGTKWASGLPVAGVADRIWVFWRRATGTVTGGPTVFYKVFRPGIRVRQGAIYGIAPAELSVSGAGSPIPQEVNPVTGSLFFTAAEEGQTYLVSYRTPTGGTIVEQQRVRWIEEQGETPVPMETSVNEGSLDAFPSFEEVGMTGYNDGATSPSAAVIHLERIWLFWSSTRNSGGDLVYAAMSPRLGPEPNINGSVTRFAVSGAALARLSANQQRQQLASYEEWEKKHPTTVPMILRRGPLAPAGMRARGAAKPK